MEKDNTEGHVCLKVLPALLRSASANANNRVEWKEAFMNNTIINKCCINLHTACDISLISHCKADVGSVNSARSLTSTNSARVRSHFALSCVFVDVHHDSFKLHT